MADVREQLERDMTWYYRATLLAGGPTAVARELAANTKETVAEARWLAERGDVGDAMQKMAVAERRAEVVLEVLRGGGA